MPEPRTPDEWCEVYGLDIRDPDGWRTSDAPPWDQPIGLPEFWERFNQCTVRDLPHIDYDRIIADVRAARGEGAARNAADRLRAEHPGETVYFGVSYGPAGPPTHSVAEAFLGTGPGPEPGTGAPVVWIRTRDTPWIRADADDPRPAAPKAHTRRASVAELRRRVATAERKAAEAGEHLAKARAALSAHPDFVEDGA